MSTNQYFEQGDGSLFVQPQGPNTVEYYLGCHDVGDIPIPMGDVTEVLCPDPAQIGRYQRVMMMQGVPGRVTTSISTYLSRSADYLEAVKCLAALYIQKNECGRRDMFTARDWGVRLENFAVTQKTISNLAHRTDRNPSGLAFDLSADTAQIYYNLLNSARAIAETEPLTTIINLNEDQCAGSCGPAMNRGKNLLATDDSAVGPALAAPWWSTNYGVTWAASAANPFAAGYHTRGACSFPVSRTVTRVLVGRGTTIPASPIGIAYTDDSGATWTTVTPGVTNAEFVPFGGGLWALDWQHIWVTGNLGNVYFSSDGGLTWATQYAAGAFILNCVRFIDKDLGLVVGSANTIARTVDGGAHWTAVAGPAAMAAVAANGCWIHDDNTFWVLYAGGQLYYTTDTGATWTQRAGLPVTMAVGCDIKFLNRYDGFVGGRCTVGGNPFGVILRTIDGGQNWEAMRSAQLAGATNGIQSVCPIDTNHCYGVGTLIGAAPVIMDIAQ